MSLPPPPDIHDVDNADNADDDDDILTIPFTQQRGYSTGLSRRPISFVSATPTSTTASTSTTNPPSISTQYLSIVSSSSNNNSPPLSPTPTYPICETCSAPVKEPTPRAHYLSFAHQHALPRAPVPSGIDRTRMGLKYLSKHGFDVDKRTGLGRSEQGIVYPVRAVEKRDRGGIGVGGKEKEERRDKNGKKVEGKVEKEREVERLDAGRVRKQAKRERRKMEALRSEFYQDEKVAKYLGELEG